MRLRLSGEAAIETGLAVLRDRYLNPQYVMGVAFLIRASPDSCNDVYYSKLVSDQAPAPRFMIFGSHLRRWYV